MKGKLTRKNSADLTHREIDWTEFDALTDAEIAAAVREDPDALRSSIALGSNPPA
jgi:hypothetical protein